MDDRARSWLNELTSVVGPFSSMSSLPFHCTIRHAATFWREFKKKNRIYLTESISTQRYYYNRFIEEIRSRVARRRLMDGARLTAAMYIYICIDTVPVARLTSERNRCTPLTAVRSSNQPIKKEKKQKNK